MNDLSNEKKKNAKIGGIIKCEHNVSENSNEESEMKKVIARKSGDGVD